MALGIPKEHQRNPLVAKVEFHFDPSMAVPLKSSSKKASLLVEAAVATFTSPDTKEVRMDNTSMMSTRKIRVFLCALMATTPAQQQNRVIRLDNN